MGKPQEYHLVWLESHPNRTEEWLKRQFAEGFHIHHLDGDHGNNEPWNLVLIEKQDHRRLHNMSKGVLYLGLRIPKKQATRMDNPSRYLPRRPLAEGAETTEDVIESGKMDDFLFCIVLTPIIIAMMIALYRAVEW